MEVELLNQTDWSGKNRENTTYGERQSLDWALGMFSADGFKPLQDSTEHGIGLQTQDTLMALKYVAKQSRHPQLLGAPAQAGRRDHRIMSETWENFHRGETDHLRFRPSFLQMLRNLPEEVALVSTVSLVEGAISGDGRYTRHTGRLELNVKTLKKEQMNKEQKHDMLASYQELLAISHIELTVNGSKTSINPKQAEFLSCT